MPYIAAEMLDRKNKTYFDVSGRVIYPLTKVQSIVLTLGTGALVYDPCIGSWAKVGQEIPAYPFAVANQAILNLPQKTLAKMESMHNNCGYGDYIE